MPLPDFHTGTRLGQFELLHEVGRGSMGVVYRARQVSIDRIVAVKILPRRLLQQQGFFDRFQREVEIAARLEHPHIVPIYDYGQYDGLPYIAMRYLGGGNLSHWVQNGEMTLEALEVPFTQICAALDHAHARGVVHRDLKPGNILLDEENTPYLSDFGIARMTGGLELTTLGELIGTPAYMSPEQAQGEPATAQADIYALGMMLYVLITGHFPFHTENLLALLDQIKREPLPSVRLVRPGVPADVDAVIQRATAKQPEARYTTAKSVARGFASAVRGNLTTGSAGGVRRGTLGSDTTVPSDDQGEQWSQATLIGLMASVFPVTAEGRRQLLLDALGPSYSVIDHIDLDSPGAIFVRELVNSLYTYDKAEPGRRALWTLVDYAAKVRGVPFDAELLGFRRPLNPAAQPASNVVPGHIFVSYSHKDRPFVDKLIADLNRRNLTVWTDKDSLKAGTRDWENAIRKALQSARAFILIASPTAQESLRVRDEIAIADDLRVPLFPVWLHGARWHDCVPLGLGSVQYIDARNEADYPEALAKLTAELSSLLLVPLDETKPDQKAEVVASQLRNPYKGLHAFTEADRADFYGRDDLANKMMEALKRYPSFLALLGASGSGKSSVIQAGLLPKLKADAASRDWYYLPPFTPTRRPILALANALIDSLPGVLITAVADSLNRKAFDGLALLAHQIAPKGRRAVLYIDQFEEVFTLASDDERGHFISLLTTAADDPDCPITIVLSMRADFYDRPPNYPELGRLIESHHMQIYPLTLAELYDVVQRPAEVVGLVFDDALVTELVYDVRDQAGPLPLLQFTLDQLYVECVERVGGYKLTRAAYRELGGVRGALTRHADAIYRGLDEDLKPFAPELFKRLVNVGETEQETTRRRASRDDLTLPNVDDTVRLARVAETFVRERLLTADRTLGGEETYEVAHEALLREWEALRDWLREARRDIRRGRRIEAAAEEWRASGENPQYLYRDEQLAEALRWRDGNMPNAQEAAFIDAGIAVQREREANLAYEQVERLRLAEEKAAAEERARLAEGARATRFRNAARFAAVLLVIALLLLAVSGVTTVNTNAALAAVEFEATVGFLRADNDLAFLHLHGVLPTQAIVLAPVSSTANPPTVIAQATRWANSVNTAWTPEERDTDGVAMVYVPQGCFLMGSGHGDANELPVNEVCLEAFWIDKYEVWQNQFVDLGGQQSERPFFRRELHPIENISWFEANNYCVRRNARLPTEAEWEYAARGPDSWVYPWGNQFPEAIGDHAVFNQSAPADVTTDSRSAGASWVGALDMSGNVWEWVNTISRDYPYRADDGREDTEDSSSERVLRGGSWSGNLPDSIRASFRIRSFPNRRDFYYGFRCARSS